MNYVRKLGFEESPDYDFLRDLFSKVLKTIHESDDNIFDWTQLNNGKGWEFSVVRSTSYQLSARKLILICHLVPILAPNSHSGSRTPPARSRAQTCQPRCRDPLSSDSSWQHHRNAPPSHTHTSTNQELLTPRWLYACFA